MSPITVPKFHPLLTGLVVKLDGFQNSSLLTKEACKCEYTSNKKAEMEIANKIKGSVSYSYIDFNLISIFLVF